VLGGSDVVEFRVEPFREILRTKLEVLEVEREKAVQ
jgi:hypothetical protein